jgi:hypothetical protein
MSHANKIIGVVAVVTALVTALLLLAGVVTTDAYSRAAQAEANGDFALLRLTASGNARPQWNNAAPQLTAPHEQQGAVQ